MRRLPRYRTSGLVGSVLAGLEFDAHPVPADALVGDEGAGAATALRAFQVSRVVTAGAGTSLLEESLATVVRFARERRLYGRTVHDLPHARSLLAGAFLDLHVAQALTRTAARALHLAPRSAGRWAAATKYLVPRLAEDALGDLAVVLGARSYLREGPYAVVGKHLRDIAGLSIGHAGGVSCQLTVLPELPGLAPQQPAGPALFDGSVPAPLDLGQLRLRGGREDGLLALLLAGDEPAAAALRTAARRTLDTAAALPASERGLTAGHRALALTDTYAWCLAAASCLGVHAASRGAAPGSPAVEVPPGERLLGTELWRDAVLHRIARRAGIDRTPSDPVVDTDLLEEVAGRTATGHSLDLHPDPVARSPF